MKEGHRLAGRVSGDSTVAYAWAYAQAVEAIAGVGVPPRAAALRALCLERERIANHLGDLGYLGNDAGFAFGLAQFSRLKEDVLRLNARACGHRLLMDGIVPGGVARDLDASAIDALREQCSALVREIAVLRDIYDEHAGLQDRFRNCGQVSRELALRLGLTGFAGRASGLADDLRCDFPTPPYDTLAVRTGHPHRRRRRRAGRGALRGDGRIAAPERGAARIAARRRASLRRCRSGRRPASPWAQSRAGAVR